MERLLPSNLLQAWWWLIYIQSCRNNTRVQILALPPKTAVRRLHFLQLPWQALHRFLLVHVYHLKLKIRNMNSIELNVVITCIRLLKRVNKYCHVCRIFTARRQFIFKGKISRITKCIRRSAQSERQAKGKRLCKTKRSIYCWYLNLPNNQELKDLDYTCKCETCLCKKARKLAKRYTAKEPLNWTNLTGC